MTSKKTINFSPGPAKLPEEVMLKAQKEFVDYEGTGISVMEMSHRGPVYSKIIKTAEADLRELMSIPDNYKVIFLQGGGCGQFAVVPLNLMNLKPGKTADYIVTGAWSSKAFKEAQKYGTPVMANAKKDVFDGVPDLAACKFNPDASYVYYCSNETIHGVEFSSVPETHGVPLVCDMSSNILSRPVDVSKFGMIYAGAQKNIGPAGVTLVIIREDLLGYAQKQCPTVLDYKVQADNGSMYNTPPAYSIYMVGLVFHWLKENGGSTNMQKRNIEKSSLIYKVIDDSNGFYASPIKPDSRSRMNVTFRIGSTTGNEELEKKFVAEAAKEGMIQIKGHRAVGGIRVSLYNAVTLAETKTMEAFMKQFHQANK